jgi:hypothetical protein
LSTPILPGTIPEPTMMGAIQNGLRVLRGDIVPLLVLQFLVTMITGVCGSLAYLIDDGGPYLTAALTALIASPFELGTAFVYLRTVRSGSVNFEHLLAVPGRYGSIVFASVLIMAIGSGATAMMIVPGMLFYCTTRFVPFLLLEDELGGAQAIIESIKLSRSCFWQLLGICSLGLVGLFLVALLARYIGIASAIGIVPIFVWWHLSIASLYHAIVRPPSGWALEDLEEHERITSNEGKEDDVEVTP